MVTDRILSQAFRNLDVSTGQININVEEGIAVLHGATHVRVGSALFGERSKSPSP